MRQSNGNATHMKAPNVLLHFLKSNIKKICQSAVIRTNNEGTKAKLRRVEDHDDLGGVCCMAGVLANGDVWIWRLNRWPPGTVL